MTALVQWQTALAASIEQQAGLSGMAENCQPLEVITTTLSEQIYRHNSQGARCNALMDIYPVCCQVVGDQAFNGLAAEYVRRYASTHHDLNQSGAQFPQWITQVINTQDCYVGLPWLVDLVRLEWAAHKLYYSADDKPNNHQAILSQTPDKLLVHSAKQIAWLSCEWPVNEIWSKHQQGLVESLHIVPQDSALLLKRDAYVVSVTSSDQDVLKLLDACKYPISLDELLEYGELSLDRLGELIQARLLVIQESSHHV